MPPRADPPHADLRHVEADIEPDVDLRRVALPIVAALLAACASMSPLPDPTATLDDAQVRTRIAGGDVIVEYRERGGAGRIVKITPADAAPFYLFDDDGDGRIDRHTGIVDARYRDALIHPMPFEDYGLLHLPPAPRRPCDHPRQPMPSVICTGRGGVSAESAER